MPNHVRRIRGRKLRKSKPRNNQTLQKPNGVVGPRVQKVGGERFAIVRAWHAAGKPRTSDTRHDFRDWAQTLDWIVQNVLGEAALLDGHSETQQRMTNTNMGWLRDVVLAVARDGRCSEWLLTSRIVDIIDEEGEIEIPGLRDGANLENDEVRTQVFKQMGRRFKKCFRDDENVLTMGSLAIERRESQDLAGRQRYEYMVYRLGAAPPGLPF